MRPTGGSYSQLWILFTSSLSRQASCHKSMKSHPSVAHGAPEALTPACLSTFTFSTILTILTPVAADLCPDPQKPSLPCFLSSESSSQPPLPGLYHASIPHSSSWPLRPASFTLPHSPLLLSVPPTEFLFVSPHLSSLPFFHENVRPMKAGTHHYITSLSV